jgi:hypothetical protein
MRKGYYGGGTIGWPSGFGGGLYADNYGNLYPQLYFGSTGSQYFRRIHFRSRWSSDGTIGCGHLRARGSWA